MAPSQLRKLPHACPRRRHHCRHCGRRLCRSGSMGRCQGRDPERTASQDDVQSQSRSRLRRRSHFGGTLEIFVEPILPQPMLYLFGGGHVSTAVARVAHQAGFAIGTVTTAKRSRTSIASRWPPKSIPRTKRPSRKSPNPSSYLVIVTRGHKDECASSPGPSRLKRVTSE